MPWLVSRQSPVLRRWPKAGHDLIAADEYAEASYCDRLCVRRTGCFGPLRGRSGRVLLRFGALRADEAAELLDLIAELADLLGQRRRVRMRGCPLPPT